jgi:uncharacterized repeat protein (TIGR03803 family)
VLYAFTGTNGDGLQPYAGVIRDSTGNLYGMTQSGGANGLGAVYRIDSTGKETILYSFTGAADGCYPYMGVTRDSAGNLYGTTDSELCRDGAGTVFKLTPSGTLTTLYSFSGGADGSGPWSGLILDSSGNLYGTTRNGGAYGYGTVYKVTSTGTETVLYSFAGGTDAQSPAFASLGSGQGREPVRDHSERWCRRLWCRFQDRHHRQGNRPAQFCSKGWQPAVWDSVPRRQRNSLRDDLWRRRPRRRSSI